MKHEEIFLQKKNSGGTDEHFTIRKKAFPIGPIYSTTLHWHDYCELELILDGRGEHRLNGDRYPVSRGDVYLLTPRDLHTLIEDEDAPIQLFNVNFDLSILPPRIADRLRAESAAIALHLNEADVRTAEGLMERMLTEFQAGQAYGGELRRALFVELLVLLLRHHTSKDLPATEGNEPIQQTIAYLKEHFREPLSLSDCAGRIFLTAGYLGELFYRCTGVHFKEYLNRLRLEYAVRLLATTSLSVAEISLESGFSTPSYFISCFRKREGITPAEHRKRLQKRT